MNYWRKPVSVLATGVAVVAFGVVGLGTSSAQHATHATARTGDSGKGIFSDDQAYDTLNPFQATTVMAVENTALTQPVGNPLVVKASGTLQTEEITDPVASNNNLTYTFDVKPGQSWSNGDDLTGYDYELYWHLGMDPLGGPLCAGFCDDISSMDLSGTEGDHIVVHLNTQNVTAEQNVIGAVGFLDTGWNLGNRGGITNTDFINCLNASGPDFSGCDNLANAEFFNANIDYTAPVTNSCAHGVTTSGTDYNTAGPWEICGIAANEVDYVANPNYTSAMPGGATAINNMEFFQYTTATNMENDASQDLTDLTEDYTLADVPTLESLGGFQTAVGGTNGPQGNPEVLTFNVGDKTIAKIDGDGSFPDNGCKTGTAKTGIHYNCINNPFYKGGGKNLRDALALAFNRAGILEYAYNQSNSDAAAEVSYCAPILCPTNPSAQPPFADAAITGQYDPIISGFQAGACAADHPNAPGVQDAELLLEQKGYSNAHPLTMDISSTTLSFRGLEMDYLNSCWSALTDGSNSGQLVVVHHENKIGSGTYFASFANNGTLAVGDFEADIHAYGGVPPDPDGWKANFDSVDCERTDTSGGNFDCIANGAIDKTFANESTEFPEFCPDGDTVVTCATDGGKTHPYAGADKRWKDFNSISLQINKNAYWTQLAPRPNVFTYDGQHPAHGWQFNGWVAQNTWNAFNYS